MRIIDGFILREVGDTVAVVAVGEKVASFNAMLKLNESGKMLFELLQKGATREEMLQSLLNEFDIDEKTARADVDSFADKLIELGVACE